MSGHLTLVLGGQKSGKSRLVAARAAQRGAPVVVITPAAVRDPEFAARVARHQADRPDDWTTRESFALADEIAGAPHAATIILDALDTWLVERLPALGIDLDGERPSADIRAAAERQLAADVVAIIAACRSRAGETLVVAGQPGLGVHAAGIGARLYVDVHGLVVRQLADAADEAVLVVAGRPLPLPSAEGFVDRAAGVGAAGADVVRAGAGSPTPPVRGTHDANRTAVDRLARLAVPPDGLGALGELAVRLSTIAACTPPPVPRRPVVVIAAGDHGVHTHGVSDWPQSVTRSMFRTVASGRAAVNAVARTVGAAIVLVDAGMVAPGDVAATMSLEEFSAAGRTDGLVVVDARVGSGTADLRRGPAMTADQCANAVDAGTRIVDRLVADGADLLALGDLGIGNTTASSALIAAVTGRAPRDVTGRGANRDDQRVAHKVAVVDDALRRHGPSGDPWGVLASLGGYEHAVLVGVLRAAATARVPVVLDGVISAAAALIATAAVPEVADVIVAGHRAAEPGSSVALDALGHAPLLDLGLRLGEGGGALLAVPLVQAAARMLGELALLDDLADDATA